MNDIVDKNMRDFNRYTGDGLPDEPVGAPLPVGDPTSGAFTPSKRDLRQWAADIEISAAASSNLYALLEAEELARQAGDEALVQGSRFCGLWDASTETSFPSERRNTTGSVQVGDWFFVTGAGTVDGQPFAESDTLRAFIDAPSTATFTDNWVRTDINDALVPVYVDLAERALDYGPRNATNAAKLAANGNGTIGWLGGLQYLVDSTATGSNSATNDLGVSGLVPFGVTETGHFGGASNMNSALANISLYMPSGVASVSGDLISDECQKFIGQVVGVDIGEELTGSVIEVSSTSVSDLLTFQSTSPDDQAATDLEGLRLSEFGLVHRGSGAALTVNNIIRSHISDVMIDCKNEGATGIQLLNWAFFAVLDRVSIQRFAEVGLIVDGEGTQHVIRDCHISANNETSGTSPTSAIEMRRFDFTISGGQYNVKRTDGEGVGILVNNTDATAVRTGGRIENTICEVGTAVKITGDSFAFEAVDIVRPFWNMGIVDKGVVFDRATRCTLTAPQVDGPLGGGILAEFGALSVGCGVVCDYQAARSPMVVNASASDAWKHVTGRVGYSERSNITTYDNLTTTVEDCEYVGRCSHNGDGWDKHYVYLNDDAAASFDVPFEGGVVTITARANGNDGCGAVGYRLGANTTQLMYGTSNFIRNDSVLSGTTGTDGKVSVGLSGGFLYLENRLGSGDGFIIEFKGYN